MTRQHHENVVPNIDIGVRFYKSDVTTSGYVPFHWHSSIELVCVLQGKLQFNFDGETHVVGPNQFIAVSSGVVHDVTNTPNHAFVLQIPLHFIAPYEEQPDRLNFYVTRKNPAAYQAVFQDFLRLNQLNTQRQIGYLFDFGAVVLDIVKILVTEFTVTAIPKQRVTSNLRDLIAYVNGSYNQPLSVRALAKRFGYNPNYLSRLFKNQVGITLVDYIYKIRLNALYHDLLTTDEAISTLMAKHGLRNPRTTRQLFKQIYNRLPHQVRQEREKTPNPE